MQVNPNPVSAFRHMVRGHFPIQQGFFSRDKSWDTSITEDMTTFWHQSAAGRSHCVIDVTFQGASEVRVLSL